MSIEEDLVKSVASKINYYIDIKQREDGFNLSRSPLRSRRPLYIPVPPPKLYPHGSNSNKRNRISIYNALQGQPSILAKRRQRVQNLSSYIPIFNGRPKRDKIVETASKFLVSLGFNNTSSLSQHRKQCKRPNKLPSLNDKKHFQDFIYDDIDSFCQEEVYLNYGEKSPDPSPRTVTSIQPTISEPEPLNSAFIPKEELRPTYSISYSADPAPDSYEVLVHSSTQTDNIRIERHLPSNVDQEYTEIKSGEETEYVLVVQTGNVLGASTRAQVKVVLCGTEGKTGALALLKSKTNKIKFQKGKEDHFTLKTFNVGFLEKIRIGHDRPELPFAWFLDSVTVYDQTEKWVYTFPCGQWFSGEDGDRQTYRELLLGKNMAMVEDIQNVTEDHLLQWMARTENLEKNKDTELFWGDKPTIEQTKTELSGCTTPDTPRSDSSSSSGDASSSFVNRFQQGTVISVQNQVSTESQTDEPPGKQHYNLARDFHKPNGNSSASEKNQSLSEEKATLVKSPNDEDNDQPQSRNNEKEDNSFNWNTKSQKSESETKPSSDKDSSNENDFFSSDSATQRLPSE